MESKCGQKRSLWLVALITLLSFASVGIAACNKEAVIAAPDKCATVVCYNKGFCRDGICSCVAGFEGDYCQEEWVGAYLGSWKVTERIIKSSEDSLKGQEKVYTWRINKSDDPVYFVIDNMRGVEDYDGLKVRIGLNEYRQFTNPDDFTIGSISFVNQDGRVNIDGGYGKLNAAGTIMTGTYYSIAIKDSIPVFDTLAFEAIYAQ